MPRYDYRCPEHGEFEAAVRFADADKPQPCPKKATMVEAIPATSGPRWGRVGKVRRVTRTCGKLCKRVARLYPANINYCDGMTKHSAVIDSENTKKHGHTI